MRYLNNTIYHIYNQGNNRETIFFNHDNYLLFINKMIRHLHPHCDILAYCLMPNHFHWLIRTNKKSIAPSNVLIPRYAGSKVIHYPKEHSQQELSKQIGTLLSSYAQAINIQEGKTGSLFRSKTKAKIVQYDTDSDQYFPTCFNYIIQNPVKAKFVSNPEDYCYSSVSSDWKVLNEHLIDYKLVNYLLQFSKTCKAQ